MALFGLTACSTPPPAHDDSTLKIVASTNVYGGIARSIAGQHAAVTSLIDSASQDPHSFEGSARDQLALSKADLVIENGGGYDDFIDTLLRGAENPDVVILNAVDIVGTAANGNEHVWYSPTFMITVANALADRMEALDPKNAADYRDSAAVFVSQTTNVNDNLEQIAAQHGGEGVAITEPVPLYLLDAAGLVNKTPAAFSTAIEDGSGVAPAVMAETLKLFTSKAVRVLVYNSQTVSPETQQLRAAANQNGIPVVALTETIPTDLDYPSWMASNIAALAQALG